MMSWPCSNTPAPNPDGPPKSYAVRQNAPHISRGRRYSQEDVMKRRFLRQPAASLLYSLMSLMTAAQTSGDTSKASAASSPLTLIATVLLLIFASLPAASAQQKTTDDA